MRESRTYGSGRGARGNSRPYREIIARSARRFVAVHESGFGTTRPFVAVQPSQPQLRVERTTRGHRENGVYAE